MSDLELDIVGYLVALTVVVFALFVWGNPKYDWSWLQRADHWCHYHVPVWVTLVGSWFLLYVPIFIVVSPLAWLFHKIWSWISGIPWPVTVPEGLQLSLPPVVVLCALVALRGVPSPLTSRKQEYRIIGLITLYEVCTSFEGQFRQAPLWMQTGWVATVAFSFWGLLGTWFAEGRRLGFWRTIWRGFEQCRFRMYDPGSPWGEEIPNFRSWLQPYGDLNEEKQSQLFGNARVASIEEMKKGGLL